MKAIIFDLGGVIALQKNLYYVPIFPDVELWKKAEKGEINEAELWQSLENYHKKTSQELIESLFNEREKNTELLAFLKEKKSEIKLGFINNGLSGMMDKMVKEWKLGDIFDVMLNSSKEKVSKPDPKIYLLASEKLGVKPEDCLYVGKKESYVDIAMSLGMKGLVYKDFVDFKNQISNLLS